MGQNKKSLVGKPTGRKSTAGKKTYITPEGEEVSEKSVSFPIKLENKVVWVNAPSIYNGVQYSEEEVRDKINAGEVKATSVHESREEAEEAAKKRSEGLLKNYAVGGVVEDKQNKKTAEDIRKEEQLARLPDLRSPVEKSFLSSLKTENRDLNDRRRNTASIEFGDDSASVSPTVRYNENNNVQELDDGVILDEKGKRIGISLNGQVRLNEGISVRGGVEKVFSSSNTTVYKASEVIDKFKSSSQGQTTSLGTTLGNVDVDLSRSKGFNSPSRTGASIGYRGDDFNLRYSQDKQDGMPAYKNLSGNIKLGDNLNVSGGIDSNKNKNIQVNYNKKYAKGGNVEQMNKLFAEGGMMDDSGESVNGVEVPPGSLREEVADDIPAQLSEGEFVVPADVVRYIGLEKLMAMRDKAKQGLQRMNEMGQMGNADEVANPDQTFSEQGDEDFEAEIDDIMAEEGDDAMPEGFALGGIVTAADIPKMEWTKNPVVDVRYFKHPDGRIMFITYLNGKPATSIPDGFVETKEPVEKLVGKAADEKEAATAPVSTGGEGSSGDSPGGPSGSTGPGQGISNTGINTALGVLGITEGLLGKTPLGAVAKGIAESYLDVQLDALDEAGNALSVSSTPDAFGLTGVAQTGMNTVSDPNGNVSTVSNNASITAQNQAIFGVNDVSDPGGLGLSEGVQGTDAAAPGFDLGATDLGSSLGDNSSDTAGIGDGADGNASYICTASYNQAMITPSHFRSLSGYGARLRKQDPYLMRAYDSFGPFLASHVGKNKVMTGVAKYLTNYWKDIHKNNVLSTKHMIQLKASTYILRPVVRFFGWVLIKFVDKK